MTITAEEGAAHRLRSPAVLSYGFRPFFLAAASWAIIALVVSLAMFLGSLQLPSRFDPLAWHIHEMLFGFVMAAVGGFLLTAIPNWTNRLPVRGGPLALLIGLWLIGRVACLVSADLPAWLAVTADVSFPIVLFAVAMREIVAGRNWRNVRMTVPVAVFVLADLLMHLESLGFAVPSGLGWRLAVVATVVLISVVGGRIIPSFTHNWLVKRHSARLPAPHGAADVWAIGVLHSGLILWAVLPDFGLTGVILVVGALLNAWRLVRWSGRATWAEPLLFILHVGYGWLVAGVALLGLSNLEAGVPVASAIHALTAGAIATMILAVMPRVTLGHTGRELVASKATVAIFLLINAAALLRVAASWSSDITMILIAVSGICWIAAFALFAVIYGPMLARPRVS